MLVRPIRRIRVHISAMSHEALCSLSRTIRADAVFSCLTELGYGRVAIGPFSYGERALRAYSWFDSADYRSHRGIYIEVVRNQGALQIYLRSQISASYWDLHKL